MPPLTAIGNADVLVVVDVLNDFLPGGALGVSDGDAVIALINALAVKFAQVVLVQDWHPAGHISFASSHPGRSPFEAIVLPDGRRQVLWPDHCVQGSHGAQVASGLSIPQARLVIRKGHRRALDSYSAFREADRTTPTGLTGYLRELSIERVFVVGLATDFCVSWTALDAAAAGFSTYVIEDLTRPIDMDNSLAQAFAAWEGAGVERISAAALAS